jgi:uncharacterized protein YbcV (DUF1398 family)
MNPQVESVVATCTRGSEDGSLDFPQVLAQLAAVGVEGYFADLRRFTKTYYLPDGSSAETSCSEHDVPVAPSFDSTAVESAVRQSQAGTHTYADFCRKIMAAGCCGYFVSLLGRRAVYFGRTGETHVEHLPPAR